LLFILFFVFFYQIIAALVSRRDF